MKTTRKEEVKNLKLKNKKLRKKFNLYKKEVGIENAECVTATTIAHGIVKSCMENVQGQKWMRVNYRRDLFQALHQAMSILETPRHK